MSSSNSVTRGQSLRESMEDFWKQLHWYNIPGLDSKPSSFDPDKILMKLMRSVDYDIYSVGKPTFLYLYNMVIPELDDINHSSGVVETLNETGIDFYLYEPLSVKTLDQASHFDNVVFSDSTIRADELDSILRYVQRNNLTNVSVYIGDYEAEKYLSYYTLHMNLVVRDLHLINLYPIHPKDKGFSFGFSRKFINLNGRYCLHRHILAAYLSKRSTHMSWFHDHDLPKETEWYNLNDWDSTVVEKLDYDLSPKFLDCVDLSILDQTSPLLEKYYRDSFCDVVGESRFHRPMGNVSEKVFKPIWYKKPFVLAAPAKTLAYLKTLGFKTFSDFWDESYDECTNHEERLKKVLTVIDFIDSMSLTELRFMYEQMLPVVEHNFKIASELVFRYWYDYSDKKHLLIQR